MSTVRNRSVGSVVGLVVGLVFLAVPSGGAGPSAIDLRDGADVVIEGTEEFMRAGSASYGGDVNGDAVPDALVGSCRSLQENVGSGTTFVVFGDAQAQNLHLDGREGGRGFRIEGAPESYACRAASVGDVNGDGLDDIGVGAAGADPQGRTDAGAVYVVFGKTSTTPVNLSTFDLGLQGDAGFRIAGPAPMTFTGTVARLGDVNGDANEDILVASPGARHSYVVFGKSESGGVDLAGFHEDPTVGGYRIKHPRPDTTSDLAVGGGGDFNGDGIPDALIGYSHDHQHPGVVAVVFGKEGSAPINTRRLGRRGFKILGVKAGDTTGHAVASAGDVNGDGLDDIIVGAPRAWKKDGRGHAYVVFGSGGTKPLRLDSLGRRGFTIRGPNKVDRAGTAVAGLGDVDRDGLDDVIVGAPLTRIGKRGAEHPYTQAGAAFVVYGKKKTLAVRLGDLGHRGYLIKGAEGIRSECESNCYGDWAGASVAPAGDMDHDGYADVIVGAPFARGGAGAVYIIWSHPFLR